MFYSQPTRADKVRDAGTMQACLCPDSYTAGVLDTRILQPLCGGCDSNSLTAGKNSTPANATRPHHLQRDLARPNIRKDLARPTVTRGVLSLVTACVGACPARGRRGALTPRPCRSRARPSSRRPTARPATCTGPPSAPTCRPPPCASALRHGCGQAQLQPNHPIIIIIILI